MLFKRCQLLAIFTLILSSTNYILPSQPNQRDIKIGIEQQDCIICLDKKDPNEFYQLSCKHAFCKDCLKGLIDSAIKSKSTESLKCSHLNCKKPIKTSDVEKITNNDPATVAPLKEIILREQIAKLAPDQQKIYKFCRTPDCPVIFVNRTGSTQRVTCGKCNKTYCANCCIDHRATVKCHDAILSLDKNASAQATAKMIKETTKPCPKCKVNIEKNAGCPYMKCTKCKHKFCWTCLKPFYHVWHDPCSRGRFGIQRNRDVRQFMRNDRRIARQNGINRAPVAAVADPVFIGRVTPTEMRRQAGVVRRNPNVHNPNARAVLGIPTAQAQQLEHERLMQQQVRNNQLAQPQLILNQNQRLVDNPEAQRAEFERLARAHRANQQQRQVAAQPRPQRRVENVQITTPTQTQPPHRDPEVIQEQRILLDNIQANKKSPNVSMSTEQTHARTSLLYKAHKPNRFHARNLPSERSITKTVEQSSNSFLLKAGIVVAAAAFIYNYFWKK